MFDFHQKATLNIFNAFLKLACDRLQVISADPELYDKFRFYSMQKRLQLLEQLWEQDFRREAAIFAIRVKQDTDRAIRELVQGFAKEEPMSENTFGYMDASGWHENLGWKRP